MLSVNDNAMMIIVFVKIIFVMIKNRVCVCKTVIEKINLTKYLQKVFKKKFVVVLSTRRISVLFLFLHSFFNYLLI